MASGDAAKLTLVAGEAGRLEVWRVETRYADGKACLAAAEKALARGEGSLARVRRHATTLAGRPAVMQEADVGGWHGWAYVVCDGGVQHRLFFTGRSPIAAGAAGDLARGAALGPAGRGGMTTGADAGPRPARPPLRRPAGRRRGPALLRAAGPGRRAGPRGGRRGGAPAWGSPRSRWPPWSRPPSATPSSWSTAGPPWRSTYDASRWPRWWTARAASTSSTSSACGSWGGASWWWGPAPAPTPTPSASTPS